MTVVHPIARAWISTGGTGARNYDEFADDAEITEIIAANPDSALAIEMPHRAPESLGKTFTDALPDAVARLAAAKEDGRYAPAEQVVGALPDQRPGRRERRRTACSRWSTPTRSPPRPTSRAWSSATRTCSSRRSASGWRWPRPRGICSRPVLLLQTGRGEELQDALRAAVDVGRGAGGDRHRPRRPYPRHLAGAGAAAAGPSWPRWPGGGELVVADGNHRSLAAQTGGLPRFLAVITTPASVPSSPTTAWSPSCRSRCGELLARLARGRRHGRPERDRRPIPARGTVTCTRPAQRVRGRRCRPSTGAAIVDGMDHALVERVLLRDALGLDPGDKRITYVGGDYPPSWLGRRGGRRPGRAGHPDRAGDRGRTSSR